MKFFCPFCTNQTFSLYAAQLGIHYDEMSLSAYGSTSVRDSALKIYALEVRMRKKPCTWPDSNPWHDVLITRSLPLCCNYLYVCLFLPTPAHVCSRLPTSAHVCIGQWPLDQKSRRQNCFPGWKKNCSKHLFHRKYSFASLSFRKNDSSAFLVDKTTFFILAE